MYILRRTLPIFGVDLVWDGKKVFACQLNKKRVHILEEHKAPNLCIATQIMRDLEDVYHEACMALC